MKDSISLLWFRQDLRVADNPALIEASRLGKIVPIYILDESSSAPYKMGGASKIYLHHSLTTLNKALKGQLNFYIGNPKNIIFKLIKKFKIENLYYNRCYEPWFLSLDKIIEKKLTALNINFNVFNGSYLWDPMQVKKKDGNFYKVFGAYKRKVRLLEPSKPLPTPKKIFWLKDESNKTTLEDFQLIPTHQWQQKITRQWTFGEKEAQKKLDNFIDQHLSGYKKYRDFPGYDHTSKLSPNLHFGEISPNQVWQSVVTTGRFNANEVDIDHFLTELTWREFSCYLLTYFKELPADNFQIKFNTFPWQHNETFLHAWKTGHTGYPLIDAGMRELWKTGYMHNRVRMVVASFLVKNLMIHWHHGRDWFWDCLVDADLANNSANWQWVAGCGVDAAPYFRLFNPTIQGEKFDSDGRYTKKFLPELKKLPNNYLFKPWQAPENILNNAGVILGINYPKPIVDLKASREKALSAYKALRSTFLK